MAEGRNLYREGKYKEALDKYNAAYNMLPSAPTTTQRKEAIANHIGDASIAVAQEYIKVGRYDEATSFCRMPSSSIPGAPSLPSRRSNT